MSDEPAIDKLDDFAHPRDCQTLVGQRAAEETFLGSYLGGRFHHAWLVTGPKGVGKASFAYRATKFLLSQEAGSAGGLFGPPETLDVETHHPAVSLINSGAHPGLTVLRRHYDPKGKKFFKNIRVDDVRRLSGFFGMTASDGGWRVVIIDTVDDMNINAANAILKILEEPPAKTVFFLLSNSPAGLLPTVQSRCRRLTLNPLSNEQVQSVIGPLLADQIDARGLASLTLLAEGSPGKAAALYAAGGLDAYYGLLDIFKTYPDYDPDTLHGLADRAAKKDNEALYRVLCELIPWWLSRFVRAASIGLDKISLMEGEADIMQDLLRHHPVPFWVDMWEHTNHLIERADTVNLDKKQVILNFFLSPTIRK